MAGRARQCFVFDVGFYNREFQVQFQEEGEDIFVRFHAAKHLKLLQARQEPVGKPSIERARGMPRVWPQSNSLMNQLILAPPTTKALSHRRPSDNFTEVN